MTLSSLAALLHLPPSPPPTLASVATALLAASGPAGWHLDEAAMLTVCLGHALAMGAEEMARRARWTVRDQQIAPWSIRVLNRRGLLRGSVPVCLLPPVPCPACGRPTPAADLPDPLAPCPACRLIVACMGELGMGERGN